MALYHHPQSSFAGHPPMPPQGYYNNFPAPSQPPPPPMGYPGAYAYPPPPPDPSAFRRDYAARLSELTMNSRPIIQSLSMIAQDILRHPDPVYAEIVAQCLKAHITRVPPWHKLPAFYVLDAISKNVYNPYATKFAEFVVPLFLDAYRQVDQQTKAKMEEMLVTWRTGSPSGKEVFGFVSQLTLERNVWGGDDATSSTNSPRKAQHAQPVTKSQVLAELEVALAQKERVAALNPSDTNIKNQATALYQLRQLVERGVSQEELSQILQQLRTKTQDATPPAPPQSMTAPPPQPQFYGYQQPHTSIPTAFGAPTPYNQPNPPAPAYGQASAPSSSSTPVLANLLPPSTSSGPSAPSNISDLFKNLVKAGLVSASGSGRNTPIHASSGSHEVAVENEKVLDEKELERESLDAKRRYAKKVLGVKIKLTAGDIVKQRPQLIETLYSDLSVQCKQCARRFPDGAAGKKALQDHLDEHFRIKRRLKESGTGRGHWRGWFISIDDFINDTGNSDRDRKGKGKAKASDNSHVSGDTTDDSRKRKRDGELDNNGGTAAHGDDELSGRASFVVVPAGEETKSIRCPVCKEAIRSEFWEEEEEWVWRGVVKVKEKIFHTVCHREMLGSAAVAARLRMETGGSRSGTPDAMKGRTPTPERVLKRKAEADEAERREGTPPNKKVAVSS